MFFCLFACLVIFDCMLDTVVSFTLLSAGYFCIPISLVEFCFGIQLNYVELIFWVLLLCFVRQGQSSFQSRAVHSPLLSECCAQCPPKYNCFPSAWREQALSTAVCERLALLLQSWMGLPRLGQRPCTQGRSASSRWASCRLPEFSQLSSLLSGTLSCRLSLPWCSLTLRSIHTTRGSLSGSTSFPPLSALTWTLAQAASWDS